MAIEIKHLTYEERLETVRVFNSWFHEAIKVHELKDQKKFEVEDALKLEIRHAAKNSTEIKLCKAALEKLKT